MLIDTIVLVKGSKIINLTVDSGTTDPSIPNVAEMFYRTDLQTLRVFNGIEWVNLSGGGGDADLLYASTVFHKADIGSKVKGILGTPLMVEDLSWARSDNGTKLPFSESTALTDGESLIIHSGIAIGTYIDVSSVKTVAVARTGSGGRFMINCYDDNFNTITTSGAVVAEEPTVLSSGPTFGGCFQVSVDSIDTMILTFDNTVSYAWIGVTGGSTDASLTSFTILSQIQSAGKVRAFPGMPADVITGTSIYNPPSLANGSINNTTVTTTGSATGDFTEVAFSQPLQGVVVTAVAGNDLTNVVFTNNTGVTVDLPSGTILVRVIKY